MKEHTNAFAWPSIQGPWSRITRPFWLVFLTARVVGAITHLYL